jgi:hypothetical protein
MAIEVEEDMESRVGGWMQWKAKSSAPVRKTRAYKRKADRGGVKLGYKNVETGKLEKPETALGALAVQQNKGIKVQKEIAAGNFGEFEGLHPDSLQWNAKDRQGRTILKGYELVVKRPRVGRIKQSVKYDVTNRRGVFFNAKTGRFQVGGYLRANIRKDDSCEVDGSKITISVRSYAPYSRPVEYGRQRGKSGQTKARPFMIPALMDTFENVGRLLGMKEG